MLREVVLCNESMLFRLFVARFLTAAQLRSLCQTNMSFSIFVYSSKEYRTPPSPCESVFAAYVSKRQQTYVIRPHTAAYVSIRHYNESPGLVRKHFPLLCQHLYFCTVEASELNFNVFFVNPSA